MADLEVAAEAALAAVNELKAHADQASLRFAALQEQLTALAGRIDSDGATLGQRVESFVAAVAADTARLATEGGEATKALFDLQGAVERAREEEDQELEGARSEVAALGEAAAALQPQITTSTEAVEATARSFSERADAIEQQMQEALSETRRFVREDVIVDLSGLVRDEVSERADDFQQHVDEGFKPEVEEKYADWESKLQTVEDLVEKAFTDARQHAEDVVLFAMAQCVTAHHAAVSDLKDLLADMVTATDDLGRSIGERETEVNDGRRTLEQKMTDASELLTTMIRALNELKTLMASYTFVEIPS